MQKYKSQSKCNKKRFNDIRELMAQIYGENSSEFKRLEKKGIFDNEKKKEYLN